MWYLWLVVGLGAIIIFIKRFDGSRGSGFDFDWIDDLTSDSDSGDSGGGDGGGD